MREKERDISSSLGSGVVKSVEPIEDGEFTGISLEPVPGNNPYCSWVLVGGSVDEAIVGRLVDVDVEITGRKRHRVIRHIINLADSSISAEAPYNIHNRVFRDNWKGRP